ncbi:unnamed protein product [Camellia sinensis]
MPCFSAAVPAAPQNDVVLGQKFKKKNDAKTQNQKRERGKKKAGGEREGKAASTSSKHLGYNGTTIGFNPYGDLWSNLRRITAIQIFSSASLHHL